MEGCPGGKQLRNASEFLREYWHVLLWKHVDRICDLFSRPETFPVSTDPVFGVTRFLNRNICPLGGKTFQTTPLANGNGYIWEKINQNEPGKDYSSLLLFMCKCYLCTAIITQRGCIE